MMKTAVGHVSAPSAVLYGNVLSTVSTASSTSLTSLAATHVDASNSSPVGIQRVLCTVLKDI